MMTRKRVLIGETSLEQLRGKTERKFRKKGGSLTQAGIRNEDLSVGPNSAINFSTCARNVIPLYPEDPLKSRGNPRYNSFFFMPVL